MSRFDVAIDALRIEPFAPGGTVMTRLTRNSLALALCAGFACAAPAAHAQDATIAKPTCARPQFPGKLASEGQKRSFNKDVEGYAACIKKYVGDHQKLADDHIKAANAAAAEYNDAVKQMQAEIDSAK